MSPPPPPFLPELIINSRASIRDVNRFAGRLEDQTPFINEVQAVCANIGWRRAVSLAKSATTAKISITKQRRNFAATAGAIGFKRGCLRPARCVTLAFLRFREANYAQPGDSQARISSNCLIRMEDRALARSRAAFPAVAGNAAVSFRTGLSLIIQSL